MLPFSPAPPLPRALDPGGNTGLDHVWLRSVRLAGAGRVQVGDSGSLDPSDDTIRTSTIDPATVFVDHDGDGLTDRTEASLGSDPARLDSDGDGVPDGRDPAPLAAPAGNDAAKVHDEIVRYVTTFVTGGPLTVYADPATWGGGGGAATTGVVLHRPLSSLPDRGGPRRCSATLAIESLVLKGGQAEATLRWDLEDTDRKSRQEHVQVRRVGNKWRVTVHVRWRPRRLDGGVGRHLSADLLIDHRRSWAPRPRAKAPSILS